MRGPAQSRLRPCESYRIITTTMMRYRLPAQGQTVVYLRLRKEVKLNRDTYRFPLFETTNVLWRYPRCRGVEIDQFVVGFCGKVHPVLRLSHQRRSESKPVVALCYGLSEVDAFVDRHFKRHEIEAYRSKPRRWRFSSSWERGQRREKFQEFLDRFVANQSAFEELFIANRCPIFVASASSGAGKRKREYKIVYNDCLKELEFFRKMDPFSAIPGASNVFRSHGPAEQAHSTGFRQRHGVDQGIRQVELSEAAGKMMRGGTQSLHPSRQFWTLHCPSHPRQSRQRKKSRAEPPSPASRAYNALEHQRICNVTFHSPLSGPS